MNLPSSISTRLQYQHKTLVDLIDGLSDEQIRRNIVPGKWSIFENVVHLSSYQHTFISRVRQMLEGNDPEFARYTAEGDPLFLDNCSKSSREIIQDLLTTRKEMAAEILLFKKEDFLKTGGHPVFGHMTLTQWLNFFLLHEAHHLFTIFKLAAELRRG
ncbi:MAG TPA: DinB family protein [Chitinophagaceae bacterium]|nr:DinB family protein [Chitinophagaceae bacterium]